MSYTRRELARLALTVIPAARLIPPSTVLGAVLEAKPNSRVKGVQIGLNVPYSLGGRNMEADLLLQNCIQLGVSGLELRSQPVETFMGAPANLIDGRGADPAVDGRSQQVAGLRSMEKARAFRKKSRPPACSSRSSSSTASTRSAMRPWTTRSSSPRRSAHARSRPRSPRTDRSASASSPTSTR